jgi:hypothetical protein
MAAQQARLEVWEHIRSRLWFEELWLTCLVTLPQFSCLLAGAGYRTAMGWAPCDNFTLLTLANISFQATSRLQGRWRFRRRALSSNKQISSMTATKLQNHPDTHTGRTSSAFHYKTNAFEKCSSFEPHGNASIMLAIVAPPACWRACSRQIILRSKKLRKIYLSE